MNDTNQHNRSDDSKGQTKSRRPLDPEVTERVLEVIQSLNSGIINVRRYPTGSAVMEMALKNGLAAAQNIFETFPSITLGVSEGKLIVNDHLLGEKLQKRGYVDSFIHSLDQKNLRSITLNQGLGHEELITLLNILGSTSEELRRIPDLNKHLQEQGIRHVALDEMVYVALSKDQTVVDKSRIEQLIDQGGPVDASRIKPGLFAEHLLKHLKIPGLRIDPEQLERMSQADFPKLAQKIAAALESHASSSFKEQDGQIVDDEGQDVPRDLDPQVHQMMKVFERVSGSLIKIPNQAVRAKIMTDLTKVITSFKADTLSRLISTQLPEASRQMNLKGYLLAQAGAERKSMIIDKLLGIYQKAADGLAPEDFSVRTEDLAESERVLKALLRKKADSGPATELAPEAVRKIEKSLTLIGQLTKDKTTPEGLLLGKVNRLLAKPPAFFAQRVVHENLAELVDRVMKAGRSDLAERIIEKLSDVLADPEPAGRQGALSGLLRIIEVLLDSSFPALAQDAFSGLLNSLGDKVDPETIRQAEAATARLLTGLIAERNYDSLNRILESLDGSGELDQPRTVLAARAWGLVSADREAVKALCRDLESGQSNFSELAARTLQALDAKIVTPRLIEILTTSEDRRVRKRCVNLIEQFGKPALAPLKSALRNGEADAPWYLIRNLVGVVGTIDAASAFDELTACTNHPEPRVRRVAYNALTQLSTSEALRALADGLDDEDLSIRRLIVTHFGLHEGRRVLDKLLVLLESSIGAGLSAEGLTQDICLALGRIGDQRAVAPLIRQIKPEGVLSFFKKKSPKIAGAAIDALSLLKAKKALPALAKQARGSNPELARAARQAIDKINS